MTVLLVDDYAPYRVLLRRLLARDGYVVAGEADDAASALDAVCALRPDLVLLDVQLPDHDGFWVAERIAALDGATKVVLMSSRPAAAFGTRLSAAPAAGFLAKDEVSAAALRQLERC